MRRYRNSLRLICALGFIVAVAACATAPAGMTQQELARGIQTIAGDARVDRNVVEFEYEGVRLIAVSDPLHDRMRLIAPITTVDQIDVERLAHMLVANFHTSLDGRYAISEGTVFAAFLHPLSSLDEKLLASAIRQVAALQRNFGSTYSSDALVFGAPAGPEV